MHIFKKLSVFTIQNKPFWILFGFALTLRLVLVWLLPFGQTVRYGLEGLNDEPSHYNYVKYLSENRQFPVQSESSKSPSAFEHNVYEYYQAPVYYVVTAFMVPITGLQGALYWGRIISWLFGVLTIFLLGNIIHLICPSKKVLASGVLVCAFFPTHVYFCSLLSNDSFSWFVGTWLLYLIMCYYEAPENKTFRFAIIISFVLALAMLVKSSSLVYYPVAACAFFFKSYKKGDVNQLWWGIAAIVFSLALVLPWYLRNLQLYGSLFAFDIGFGPQGCYLRSFTEIIQFGARTARLFWFPMQHVANDSILLSLLNCLGPLLILLYAGVALLDVFAKVRRKKLDFKEQLLWLNLILSVVAYIKLNMNWSNPEGRYLFTAIAPVIALFSASPARLLKGKKEFWYRGIAVIAAIYGYFYFLVI